MNDENPPKRRYDSSRRKAQARQTAQLILDGALKTFTQWGYSGATLESIAREAGVAVETVYATFGNKRSILTRLINVSLVGDDDPTPLLQREGPRAVLQDTDQVRQIRSFSDDMSGIMARMAPLFEVMRSAAKTEPDIAGLLHKMLNDRAEAMKVFIRALMRNGPLRDSLTLDEAADTVWAVTSGEVYTLLVVDRGWDLTKYKQWLASTLQRLILS